VGCGDIRAWLYGLNQCSGATFATSIPTLKLPRKHEFNSFRPDRARRAYSSWTPQVTYDIAYDMWLNTTDTKTPCQTDGTVEIMVWTDYDERALLPANEKVESANRPLQSERRPPLWKSGLVGLREQRLPRGHTEPWGGTVWVVLNRPDIVRRGSVSVNLSAVFSDVGSVLQKHYAWNNFRTTYWLDTIPFRDRVRPAGTHL